MKYILSFLLQFIIITQVFPQILTESNLPIVVITTGNTEIPDDPKIIARMGIIDNGAGNINSISDDFNHYNGQIGIETRGNSTQGFDKKTYSLELRTNANEDTSIALLNMPKEEDWILHAMVIDKTQLRIPMSFYWFRSMGHYAANWRYVELVIDGDYRGLYLLTERIKRDKGRVDISKLTQNEITGDDVTGGYILRIDWLDDLDNGALESHYNSQGETPMTYQWYYPKPANIQPEQAAYIKGVMDDFENAVFAYDFKNGLGKRYTEYINTSSFVDFLLINELSKNADGYKLSSYLHKDKDSKGGLLNAGPIWDFDQTYGLSTVCSNDDYTGWTFLQNQEGCEDLESMPMWWQAMVSDSIFCSLVIQRWQELREDLFAEASIMSWIDNQKTIISKAIDRNFRKWDDVIGESIWIEPEPIPATYDAEITYMKDWIRNRLRWMDNNIETLRDTENPNFNTAYIYPNPANNQVYIENNKGNTIQIFAMNGQLLLTKKITENLQAINIAQFQTGVYIVNVIGGLGGFEPTKLLIIK